MTEKRGHCLCGAVSWVYEGPETWRGHCHCQSCRRNCAAPFTSFMGVKLSSFRWTGQAPAVYRSSPGVRRSFCATCGTPMAYESDKFSGEIDLYAAALEKPEDFQPDLHVHYAERLPWVHLEDDLPRHEHGTT